MLTTVPVTISVDMFRVESNCWSTGATFAMLMFNGAVKIIITIIPSANMFMIEECERALTTIPWITFLLLFLIGFSPKGILILAYLKQQGFMISREFELM